MDFANEEYNEILNIFQVESEEILSRLNNSLVELENKPNNKEIILQLFRDAHSLKGAARMIGFESIQNLAHKIEDVLGLAKDNKLFINTKIADILYKTIDFISEMIQESITQKEDVQNPELIKQIEMLDSIQNMEDATSQQKESEVFNVEILEKKSKHVNKLITNILIKLMSLEMLPNAENIEKALVPINALYKEFEAIGFFEIKMSIENMKVKLDFVLNTSCILNPQEIDELQNEMNNVITNYTSICEVQGVEILDYYSLAFESNGDEEISNDENLLDENNDHDPKASTIAIFQKVLESIDALNGNPSMLNDIKDKLSNIEKYTTISEITRITKKIIEIIDYITQKEIEIDNVIISGLKQGIDFCINIISNSDENADIEMVCQRLEILYQLLSINPETENDLKLPTSKTFKIKNKNITDFSKIFDTGEIKTLRVDSRKLDALVNQIGELIITKMKLKERLHQIETLSNEISEWQWNSMKTISHLKYYEKMHNQGSGSEVSSSFFSKQLLNLFAENNAAMSRGLFDINKIHRGLQEDDIKMDTIITDIKDMVKDIRVLPLSTVFHLFGRMVRDIAKEKNKLINLEIIGSETCADKKIIEEIKTPLIHIIRNSIDHGIESPEQRIAYGKDPTGKIIIKAQHSDNKVILQIIDDGMGMNIEKIRLKAVEKGFLTQDEANAMTPDELVNLIFLPGFTTGDEITNISGRGIGLDVVQTKINQLGGKVKVISELHKGCCIQIELPVKMATVKVFLIKCGNQTFAMPMSTINTIIRYKIEDIEEHNNYYSIKFMDKKINMYYLSDILHLPFKENKKAFQTVLIIETDNKFTGIAVEQLLGDQEIMHKKLSAPLYKLQNISGVANSVNGDICLILSVPELIKNATVRKNKQTYTQRIKASTVKEEYGFKRILLLDDSTTTIRFERNLLTSTGFQVDAATNIDEALEKMEKFGYALLIVDIDLQEENGIDFIRNIRTNEMYADIPIIILTAVDTENCRQAVFQLGVKGFIVKGQFDQDEYLKTIERAILNG